MEAKIENGKICKDSEWQCPQCTVFNHLERPGCEVCSAGRPNFIRVDSSRFLSNIGELPDGQQNVWVCTKCTLINDINRPGCAACADYKSNMNTADSSLYANLLKAHDASAFRNSDLFECPICIKECQPGNGIILKECFHKICNECFALHILYTQDVAVVCPFADQNYNCESIITEAEIKKIAPSAIYENYLRQTIVMAEKMIPNSFGCKQPNCDGWGIIDNDGNNIFICQVCNLNSCIVCDVPYHTSMSCEQYESLMLYVKTFRDGNDVSIQSMQSKAMLADLLIKGLAMKCPHCDTIIQKIDGCNHMVCTVCRNKFNWYPVERI